MTDLPSIAVQVGFPIVLGSALVDITDAHPGTERDYDQTYARDRFYAGGTLSPYVFAGRRWITPRSLKRLRHCAPASAIAAEPERGSFLHVFWIVRGAEELWSAWGSLNVEQQFAQGRATTDECVHLFTSRPRVRWTLGRDDGVPAEQALDHPFPALAVIVLSARDVSGADELDDWYRRTRAPTLLQAGSSAALCLSMSPEPLGIRNVGDLGVTDVTSSPLLLYLWFLDDDPARCWGPLFGDEAAVIDSSALGRLEWSSPFVPTIPGTDRHLDGL